MPAPRRLVAPLAVVLALAVMATGSVIAQAEDGDIDILIQGPADTVTLTYSLPSGFLQPADSIPVSSGCYPLEGDLQVCVSNVGQPRTIVPEFTLRSHEFITSGTDANIGLAWMAQEAVAATSAYFDIPVDHRITSYGGAELRAYMLHRILDVIDRSAYGEPMTPGEQFAASFVEQEVLDLGTRITGYAKEEYERWQREECFYSPPSAPAFVENPVGLPRDVFRWCARPKSIAETAFAFDPPMPGVEDFLSWGIYRNASHLGLDGDGPEDERAISDAIAAGVVLGGIATSGLAAGGAAALAGSSAAIAKIGAALMGSFSLKLSGGSAAFTALIPAKISATGAGALAGAVGIVIFATIAIAISIFKVTQRYEVGNVLADMHRAAKNAKDPFDLVALQAEYAGLELRERMTAENIPDYRKPANVEMLRDLLRSWTMSDGLGNVIPGPVGLWTPNGTTADDYHFEVSVDGGPWEQRESIDVPVEDGETTNVRFNQRWMILRPEEGNSRAALHFGYLDEDGTVSRAVRSSRGGQLGFVITKTDAEGHGVGVFSEILSYTDHAGKRVEVKIAPPPASVLGGLRPSAAGALVPGRIVNLRPNPVAENGHFDLSRFTADDYDYSWTVSRYDPDAESWEQLEELPGYGVQFTPDSPGDYRAAVTAEPRAEVDGETVDGLLEFRIETPRVRIDTLELDDDGAGRLELRLAATSLAPIDELDVTITWPGEVGEAAVEETFALPCQEGFADCVSQLTTLEHLLPELVDVAQGVTVTVVNSYGMGATEVIALDDPGRLRFTEPEEEPRPGQTGGVAFTGTGAHAVVPVEVDEPTDYELATIVPADDDGSFEIGLRLPGSSGATAMVDLGDGVTMSVAQEPGGRWALTAQIRGELEDLGPREIPIIVQQSSGQHSPFVLRLDLVVASADRYRSMVLTDPPRAGNSFLVVDSVPLVETHLSGGSSGVDLSGEELCVRIQDQVDGSAGQSCSPLGEAFEIGEKYYADVPFEALLPDGIKGERLYEVSTWLRGDEERVYPGTHAAVFRLLTGPPVVNEIAWDNASRTVTLDAAAAAGTALTAVDCVLDGADIPCFGTGFDAWAPPGIEPGSHSLRAVIRTDSGNYAVTTLAFTVTEPGTGEPGGGEPDGEEPGDPDGEDPGSGDSPGDGTPSGAPPRAAAPSSPDGTAQGSAEQERSDAEETDPTTDAEPEGRTDGEPPQLQPSDDASGTDAGEGFPTMLLVIAGIVLLAGAIGVLGVVLMRRRES